MNQLLQTTHYQLLTIAAVLGGSLFAWWSIVIPRVALVLLGISLAAGQLIRLPLPGQGGGLLVSDLAVILVLITAGAHVIVGGTHVIARLDRAIQLKSLVTSYQLLVALIFWSLLTLLIGSSMLNLTLPEFTISFSYWLRLTAYLLLFPALLLVLPSPLRGESSGEGKSGANILTATIAILAVAGIIQYFIFGDFTFLSAEFGWDPHQSRLTSTWLDPNFFGAFLVMVIPYLLLSAFPSPLWGEGRGEGKSITRWVLLLLTITALVLTKSRSSYAAAISVAVLLPFVIPKIKWTTSRLILGAALTFIIVTGGLMSIALLGERASSMFTRDPTAQLRLDSIQLAWQRLLEPNWLLGVGYNNYQFAAADAGLISDFTHHSRAGADNSLLTIWITTGLPGLLLTALAIATLAFSLLRRWQQGSAYALAALTALVALIVHSQFVNSLLYPHLLITLAWLVALAEANQRHCDPAIGGRSNPLKKHL